MAPVFGDLIQINDVQTLNSQTLMNVYYFRINTLTGLSDGHYALLSSWFQTNIMTPVRAIQHGRLVHTGVQIRNLSNGLDYYEDAISLAGTFSAASGEDSPPFLTNTFKLVRESLVTRNGYKRYAGVTDGMILAGVSSLSIPLQTAVIDALKKDWVDGIVTLAEPVIPKRPLATPAGAYLYSGVGDAQYRGIGTQNTRKIGRGI